MKNKKDMTTMKISKDSIKWSIRFSGGIGHEIGESLSKDDTLLLSSAIASWLWEKNINNNQPHKSFKEFITGVENQYNIKTKLIQFCEKFKELDILKYIEGDDKDEK